MSPDLSQLLLRLLRHRHLSDDDASQRSDRLVEEFLSNSAADDDGRPMGTPDLKDDPKKKRADARRCFYHAVNCW